MMVKTAESVMWDPVANNMIVNCNEYIVIKVYAFEKGYGKKEEHKHRQGQNVYN